MIDPRPKRRLYQFSLQTLLIIMFIACLGFAWIGGRLRRARENRDRVAAVEKSVGYAEKNHAIVEYEYAKRRPATWLEELFDDPGGPADPVVVLEVRSVMFSLGSDTDLQHLQGMKNLKKLELGITGATDANLENLSELLPNLHILGLSYCQISDAGLEHLRGLTNLRILNLKGTDVTDEGVEKLQQALPNCEISH